MRKIWDEISGSNRKRQLKSFAIDAKKALWFSEAFGLTPKTLKCSSREGNNVNVQLSHHKEYTSLDSDDKQKLRELLYILDKFSISDAAYHELSMFNENLPRKLLIVQERANINDTIQVERTPGETPGAYVSIKDEIKRYIQENEPDNESPIKVKLAGDDSKVSRISNFVILTLSFPDENNCVSINNMRTVGVIKCRETYEDISVVCVQIFSEFNDLLAHPEILVGDKLF